MRPTRKTLVILFEPNIETNAIFVLRRNGATLINADRRSWSWLIASLLLAALVSCSGSASRATPVGPVPSPTPVIATLVPVSSPSVDTAGPGEGVVSAATQLLTILAPLDGATLSAGSIRVIGMVPQDAAVAVNGLVVPVKADGSFHVDLVLDDDVFNIEVSASDLSGATASTHLAVFNIPDNSDPTLDVLYPRDGLQISTPSIELTGVTSAGAAVAVNGVPVSPNALGIFSKRVDVSEGVNLIEVVSVNAAGDSRSAQFSVFYVP